MTRGARRPEGAHRAGGSGGPASPRTVPVAPIAALVGTVTVLGALGVLPREPLLVHLVAIPPLGLTADLRLLLATAPGVLPALGAAVLTTAGRVVLLTLCLGGLDRSRVGLAARWYAIVAVPAFAAAALSVVGAATLFALVAWWGFALAVVTTAITAAVPWGPGETLRRRARSALASRGRLATVLVALGGLAGLGLLADALGPAGAVGLVPASGALTWWTLRELARGPGSVRRRAVRRTAAAVPAAGLVVLAIAAATDPVDSPSPGPEVGERPGTLVLVGGVDSATGDGAVFRLDPEAIGWPCARTAYFSYAGSGPGVAAEEAGEAVCPVTSGAPYRAPDTVRDLEDLVATFEDQVGALDPPVTVLAHSQGAWVAWEALRRDRAPGVEHVVLLGALTDNPLGLPPPGSPGGATTGTVRGALGLPALPIATSFRPDAPLAARLMTVPGSVGRHFADPGTRADDVRVLVVPSAFDAAIVDTPGVVAGAVAACAVPALHGNVPLAGETHRAVDRFLAGADPPACSTAAATVGMLARAVRPFGPPAGDRPRPLVTGRSHRPE